MDRSLGRPSPAFVLAAISLFVSLGGSAVALQGRNTVLSDDIRNGQVRRADIRVNAVNGARVADNTLRSADVAGLTGADVGGLTGANIADGTLAGADVGDGTLTGADIEDLSIEAGDLANLAGLRLAPATGPAGGISFNGGDYSLYNDPTGTLRLPDDLAVGAEAATGVLLEEAGVLTVNGVTSGGGYIRINGSRAGPPLGIGENQVVIYLKDNGTSDRLMAAFDNGEFPLAQDP